MIRARDIAAALAVLSYHPGAATADKLPVLPEEQAEYGPLDDDDLDRQRGGFIWAGMAISLGAEIRSYVDGKLIAQTNLTWRDGGTSLQRIVFTNATDAAAMETGNAMLSAIGFQLRTGDGAMALANQGRTAFIQAVGGSLRSIVVNAANGTNLRQEMDVTIDIANFAPVRRAAVASRVGLSMTGLPRR